MTKSSLKYVRVRNGTSALVGRFKCNADARTQRALKKRVRERAEAIGRKNFRDSSALGKFFPSFSDVKMGSLEVSQPSRTGATAKFAGKAFVAMRNGPRKQRHHAAQSAKNIFGEFQKMPASHNQGAATILTKN